MSDRVPSDHPTISTIDATLSRSGATDRPRIDIPAEAADDVPAGEVVRLVLDDQEYRTRIERAFSGDGLQIRGAYDSPRLARNPGDGENRLIEWYEDSGLAFGRTILLDVVTEGFKYGLRTPGSRAVYDATEAPSDSLASIAEQLEDES